MNAKQVRTWLAKKAPDYMLVGTEWLQEVQDRAAIADSLRTIVEAELAVTTEERDDALHELEQCRREIVRLDHDLSGLGLVEVIRERDAALEQCRAMADRLAENAGRRIVDKRESRG